ncbi:MAG: Bax inhibitor-1/YccA family protein [Pseudomonadales bacterium]
MNDRFRDTDPRRPVAIARVADDRTVFSGHDTAGLAGNRVLANTYRLLSMTLLFSAAVAGASVALNMPHPGLLITLVGYFGLLFLTTRLRTSVWGLVSVFGLTGFMGYTLGPIIGHYLAMANGTTIVGSAMAATGAAFVGLSIYARRADSPDMLRFGPFLTAGILVAFVLSLVAYFFAIPGLSLVLSGVFALLMCGLILFETQNIVRGGETNYIMATVTLFVSIYNLFVSLLHLIGFASDD